jgi:hypothetical protein
MKIRNLENTFVNIGLIILSGIVFLFCETLYMGVWSSMFMGTIVMLYILFSNIIGLIFSIIYSKKTYTTLINYGLLIISAIITYNLTNIIAHLFEKINIMFSVIFYILILILAGNIFSYLIVKIIMRHTKNTK